MFPNPIREMRRNAFAVMCRKIAGTDAVAWGLKGCLSGVRQRVCLSLMAVAFAAGATSSVFAQVYPTWQGGGTNWGDAANWNVAYGQGQLQWTGGGSASSWNDFGSPQSQWRFYFDGSTAYTLGGNQVNFYDYGGNRGGILSDSTALQTIGMNLSFEDSGSGRPMFIFTRSSGGLAFNGGVNTAGNFDSLGIGGSNSSSVITFNGAVTGNKPLVIGTNAFDGNTTGMGSTRVVFAGSNSYSGTTTVLNGALTVADNNALGSTNSGTEVKSGAVLRLSNGITISGEALTLAGTGINSDGALRSVGGSNAYLGLITASSSTTYLGAATNATLVVSNVNSGSQELWVVGDGTTVIAGGATNSGSGTAFVKTNTGTAVLVSSNAWSGNEYIRQGTVILSNNNALGSAGTTHLGAADGATAAAATLQLGLGIVNSNAVNVVGGGDGQRTLSYQAGSGTASQLGGITLNSNSLVLDVKTNGTLLFGGTLAVNTGGGNTNRLVIGGGGTVVVTNNGSGISGSDRYQVRIGEGSLVIGSGSIISRTNTAGVGHAIDLGVDAGGNVVTGSSSLYASNGVTVSNSVFVSSTGGASRVVGLSGTGQAVFSGNIGLDNAALTVTAATNGNAAFTGAITNFSGNGSLIKTGDGTVTLSGSNTYSGGTLVSAGALQGDTRGIQGAITNNAAVVFTNSTNGTYSGAMSGNGSLTKTGAGTVTLSAANTYSGLTTVSNGGLRLAGTGITIAGDIVIAGGTLSYSNAVNDQIADTSTITMSSGAFELGARTETIASMAMSGGTLSISSGTLGLDGSSSFTGGTVNLTNNNARINTGGTTTLGNVTFNYTHASGDNNAVVLGGDVNVNASTTANFSNSGGGEVRLNLNNAVRTFDIGSAGNLNLDWVVWSSTASSGGITKTGAGTLSLSKANTYSGGTIIQGGTMILSGDGTLGAASGAVTVDGGTLDLGGLTRTNGAVTISSGLITNGTLQGSSFASTNAGTVDAVLAGAGAGLTKTGSGTLTLTQSNTYTGATTINDGTVALSGGSGALAPATTVAVNSGGTLDLGGRNQEIAGLAGAGNVTNSSGTLTVNKASGTDNFSGVMSGGGGLTKTGAGTLALSGANTYTGATTISGGTLRLNGGGSNTIVGNVLINGGTLNYQSATNNQIANTAAMTITSGTFEVGARTQTLASLDMSGGVITIGSGTLTMTNPSSITGGSVTMTAQSSDVRFNNTLSLGGATFIYSNANDATAGLRLSNTVTYSAANTAATVFTNTAGGSGRVNLGSGTREFNIADSATLDPSTPEVTINWTLANGGIIKTGDGVLLLGQTNSHAGGTTLNGGTLLVGTDTSLGTGTVTLSNGTIATATNVARTLANNLTIAGDVTFGESSRGTGSLTFSSTATNNLGGATRTLTTLVDTTIAGALGNGNITKQGAGSLILNNANSSFGSLAINAGTVAFQTNASITGLGGSGSGALNLAGGTLTVNGSTNSSFGQVISGSGNLAKSGPGTLVLSGENTYSGTTTVDGGSLVLSNTGGEALKNTGSITVNSGASLVLAADNQIGSSTDLILNGGTFVVGTSGTRYSDELGTLTLAASSMIDLGSWEGGTNTLKFADSSAITWAPEAILTITNWQGTPLTPSTVSEILFGNAGLTEAQMAQIRFASQGGLSGILLGDELVPVPEPRVYVAAAALAFVMGWRERRRIFSAGRRLMGGSRRVS